MIPLPKILVIDDDPMIRRTLSDILRAKGYETVAAKNGREGLEAMRGGADLVLTDLRLPDISGLEVMGQIKGVSPSTEVIVLTGHGTMESAIEATNQGAFSYLLKPYDMQHLLLTIRHALEKQQAAEGLKRSEERLAEAQRIAQMGNWEWDAETGRDWWSDEAFRILGLNPHATQASLELLFRHIHPDDLEFVKRSIRELRDENKPLAVDFRIRRADGAERFVHAEGRAERGEAGNLLRILGFAQDITERKAAEEKIHFLAYYDSLTGLPNRAFFKELIQRELAYVRRRGKRLAVCFIDLDNFKEINDSLGHEAGDRLLRGVAERILNSVRGSDYIARPSGGGATDLLSRLGGDEFILLLNNLDHAQDAGTAGRRILKTISLPYPLNGHEVFITASIGISLFPEDAEDAGTLLRNADLAMYHAKGRGRNNCQFFSKSLNLTAMEKLAVERSLEEALQREEFVLYYQSMLETSTRKVIGTEALLRWRRPGRDTALPETFIQSAEENGLIVPIGEWVLRSACRQGRAWEEMPIGPMTVAVNLSRRQLEQKNLIDVVTRVLSETRFPPSLLELEITESTVMRNLDEAIATLRELKGMGVRIAMDDFGTGYSSMNYLRKIPLDSLKIDREFVENITRNRQDAAVVKVMIDLAHSLDLKVIAEGVETEPQAAFLLDQGCDRVQGYLFSRPIPAEEMTRVLGLGESIP